MLLNSSIEKGSKSKSEFLARQEEKGRFIFKK